METEEREVYLDEVKDFAECGLCGTAAVISPVGKIVDHGKEICFPAGMEKMGPVTQKLYETLTGIRMGHIKAPEGWIHVIKQGLYFRFEWEIWNAKGAVALANILLGGSPTSAQNGIEISYGSDAISINAVHS